MSTYINSIEFKGVLEERIAKKKIEFKPGVNVLCGPNGSGKTTLLQVLCQLDKWEEGIKKIDYKVGKFLAFDFEKDNPRVKSYFSGNPAELIGRFKSHGEVVRAIIAEIKNPRAKGFLLMYDEPEQALDLEGLRLLVEYMKESKAKQIICASHSPFLILQPEYNIVELERGYKRMMEAQLEILLRKKSVKKRKST